jgi:anti-sigma factor ChrR (cupin superfamily)
MNTDHRCFCELAPLYALDALDQEDRAWVETQLADCPELALELAQYETAMAAMPYATPQRPMAPGLKDRLFQRIGKPTPETRPLELTDTAFPGVIVRLMEMGATSVLNRDVVRSRDLKWQDYRVPGIQIARLHVDLAKREATGLLKAEPGAHYPMHRHADTEEIFMLQGDLMIGDRVYGSGDYIRSQPGTAHAPRTHGGCMFFFRASLDNEFLEEFAMA